MPDKSMKDLLIYECPEIKEFLDENGFEHLHVRKYGKHLIIYSIEDEEKVSRARFTLMKNGDFTLEMIDHRETWFPTPYRGSTKELLIQLTQQFSFALAKF
ncbi:hypothetical protein H1S01_02985 [Heliobacterium chlorum]|uniref:Uncharacterized protein n=1 Tax=Heliobacterium chlorum TaxID=2698 RepID=A0ABR7T0M4_HELCL|nr:hypothetical protein [Heliobacterium chlorum]MBC9783475.1 hypothetical protein [Heliobacterium chlorum]